MAWRHKVRESCRDESAVDQKRRLLLAGLALSPLARHAHSAPGGGGSDAIAQDAYIPRVKHALLIGNRNYPNRKDIPPAHKNVADLREALEFLEFKVSSHLDLDAKSMRQVVGDFAGQVRALEEKSMPGSLAVVLYFCGHGFQSEGVNYLIPAGIDPSSENAVKSSLRLIEDIMAPFPQRYPGISIALIDACRTDPIFKRGIDEMNQIIAPKGSLVFFATRAGRPALAPIDEKRNTFFAEALVNTLNAGNGVTPIDELFQLAALRCQARVKEEFDKVSLNLQPQYPESTANLQGKFIIRNRLLEELRQKRFQEAHSRPEGVQLEKRWSEIRQSTRPARLIILCEKFLKDFQDTEYHQTIQVILAGARESLRGQREAGLTADALVDSAGNDDYKDNISKALRGDKDASYRIARMYLDGEGGLVANKRRFEQWLRFAVELGNGIAAWELAEYYNTTDQIGDTARYERLAIELGYRPPPRLATKGY